MGIGEVGEKLRRSTVLVRRSGSRDSGGGSGIVWRSDGVVLTNAHVVGDAARVAIELWDGRRLPAEVEDVDALRDLARLKIAAADLPSLEFRDAAGRRGEPVIAIGNPLGFTGAMTTGVVRASGPVDGLGRRPWVQTAIRLAPGNSGGPLADSEGRVIGINTMVLSGGISLAVPADAAAKFAVRTATPKLGVTLQEVVLEQGKKGLLILSVEPHTRAEEASLLIGDVLLRWNGARLESCEDFQEAIASTSGGTARLQFVRGDRSRIRQVTVKLGPPRAAGFAA